MTAEFAAAMPAVVLVLAVCLAAAQLGVQQVRLQDAAAHAARALMRGDPMPPLVGQLGASVSSGQSGAMFCTRLTTGVTGVLGVIAAGPLAAESCVPAQRL